jgi:hypothetical protein
MGRKENLVKGKRQKNAKRRRELGEVRKNGIME